MYLVLNKKSSNYQLIYFKDSKRTSVSTGTKDKKEAEKFKASFIPQPVSEPITKKVSIKLSNFANEYKKQLCTNQ